ncbi:sugar phosphate isomerase/epimerase [Lactiplantibacillus xiangfangensis]|uniref:sugar phosphate isomerase/epimerase family protein n=1 Tax=Lactiplantibacillus xiangfangensis TaxID=942150 RepID=UPI00070EEC7A|nr:sugar phosphate isomerase/epimerase [Lactiplantibacillus xiangfangensis]
MAKIGFITNCLTGSFAEKVKVAHRLGYTTLEVACWPVGHPKQCDIDADHYGSQDLLSIKKLLNHEQITIHTLAFYENMLHPDRQQQQHNLQHLKRVIALAGDLKVPYVGTYIGKNPNVSLADNFEEYARVFSDIVAFAAKKDVTVLIENCPMPTWDPEGYPATISYTPEMWQRMFELVPNQNYGLNFDPSHLAWMGIDYIQAAKDFSNRIYSVHVKDITTKQNDIGRYGIYGKKIDQTHKYDFGYYQPTLAGYGDLNWEKLFSVLSKKGFEGPVQVEYKNSNGYGSIDDPERGLQLSLAYLKEILAIKE